MTRIKPLHDWNLTPKQAVQLQKELAQRVVLEDALYTPRYVAGVDVGFEDGGATTRAAVVVLQLETLEPVDQVIARRPTDFPYVPGLLSFREIPTVLKAMEKLTVWPELLLCDGHGIAHPRRLGIASHLGLIADLPSLGVGKSRLCGSHESVPDRKGAWVPLQDKGMTIGAVLRSRVGVKPIYISAGHKISLDTAIHTVLRCLTKYRLPETTRLADKLASNRGITRNSTGTEA
ncbi:MAG: deoxyribonuclease V [Salinisphaeraceae bacterium]|nr:deoxyribonuclease V [Salinisphaeraceae bacterium]